MRCCVKGCAIKIYVGGVSGFMIPILDLETRRKWIKACGHEGTSEIYPSSRVCDRHFPRSDFEPFSLFCGNKKRLKKHAVPSLCLPSSEYASPARDPEQNFDFGKGAGV